MGTSNSRTSRTPRPTLIFSVLVVFAGGLFAATGVLAQVENLCVTDVVPDPDPSCGSEVCDQIHGTVAEALSAAAELPSDGDGFRPEVWICMGHELADSGVPHVETVVVDNRGGTYGDPLSLILQRPMCPDPDSGLSQPLVEVVTNREVTISGPVTDMRSAGPCAASARPGVSIWGGGQGTVIAPLINGWSGYGIANGLTGGPVDLIVGEGGLLNGSGYAIRSSAEYTVFEMEIAGNRTDGAVALIWLDAPDQRLRLGDSAVYGNLVNGVTSEALVLGAPAIVRNTAFIANGSTDGQPLVETGPVHPDYEEGGLGAYGGIQNVVFARNRSLAYAPGEVDEVIPGLYEGGVENSCSGVVDEPYWTRPAPFGDIPIGEESSMVRVASQLAEGIENNEVGLFLVARTLSVGNDPGPSVDADLPGRAVDVVFVHNTFADNEGAPALSLSGTGETTVSFVRNLYVDEPAGAIVELGTTPSSVVSTMNASRDSVRWVEPAGDLPHALLGPDLHFDSSSFLQPYLLRSLTVCERAAAVCPDVEEEDCLDDVGLSYACMPDIAAEYVPSDEMSAQIQDPWPWQTDWFGTPALTVAGATGWRCGNLTGTYDQWEHEGDRDGFPDVVDCNNSDADIVPHLPEHDGYSSIWCDATEVDCYTCPEDTSPPPVTEEPPEEPPNCLGCGFSWSCEEGILLWLPTCGLVPLVRRRRTTRDQR